MIRLLMLIGVLLAPALASAQATHLCTGLGQDARDEAKAFDHNLKLVFAEKGGAFLGEVSVKVERGGTAAYDGVCDGPWLLLKLDPGRYRVTATFEGQSNSIDAEVGTGKTQKTMTFEAAD